MQTELMSIIKAISWRTSRKWNMDREDIAQEMVLHLLSQGVDVEWMDDEDIEKDEREDLVRQLRSCLFYVGERYARKEKALKGGYSIDDEAFYSRARIEQLLEWYLEVGIEEHAPTGASESVTHTKSDGAESGNHLAAMLDIDRGLSLIKPGYLSRLQVRFGPLCKYSDDQIAAMSQSEIKDVTGWHHERLRDVLGTTGDQIRHRVDTAVKDLQRTLGGLSPWNRGPTPRRIYQDAA